MIPLFVFMALVLERTGISDGLYIAMYRWMGHVRGDGIPLRVALDQRLGLGDGARRHAYLEPLVEEVPDEGPGYQTGAEDEDALHGNLP